MAAALQRQPDDDLVGSTVGRIWLKTRLVDGAPHGVVPAPSGAEAAPHPTEMISDDITSQLNPFGSLVPGANACPLPTRRGGGAGRADPERI